MACRFGRVNSSALPWNSFGAWLKDHFGERVHRACIDAGFTCPNRDGSKAFGGCTFCDAVGSAAGHVESALAIRRQVGEQIASGAARHGARKFIAYFQAFTNTYAPVGRLREVYDAALEDPRIVALSVATRSDCVTDGACGLIASYRGRCMPWLEVGLQTVNQATLDRVNRAERVEDFAAACDTARRHGLPVVAHLMLGLPGDSREDSLRAVEHINECGVWGVKIHNLYIDSSAPMAEEWRAGRVEVPAEGEYVSFVCDALERLSPGVLVHRLCASAPKERHLAPAWALNKTAVLDAIRREFARRATRQGSAIAGGATRG
jgi:hypothetical protein